MFLCYKNKLSEEELLGRPIDYCLEEPFAPVDKMLFRGDNIDVMKFLLQNGYANKIDLVYIDPPFATNNTFTIDGDRISTISHGNNGKTAYSDNLTGGEFLDFLRARLILLRELLSDCGSIYLHIDYKIGHYVKIIMDEIFGIKNFRNDITRIKCNPKNFSRSAYGNIKDMILFYSKSEQPIWNDPREPMDDNDICIRFNKVDANGNRYTTVPLHAPGETKSGPTGGTWRGMSPPVGRHWRCDPKELDKLDAAGLIEWSKNGNPRRIIYAEDSISKGKKIQDVWTFKDSPYPLYPTEKNLDMLKEIIKASSEENSIVLDCFSGSGTTLVAAEELHRRWIGIDQSEIAISISDERLQHHMGLFSQNYKKYIFKKIQKDFIRQTK